MSSNVPMPICEGWLEKHSIGRTIFSTSGWHKRFFFVTPDGIGYSHRNPRESKSRSTSANRPLKPSVAQSFIPFGKRQDGVYQLNPVYLLQDASAARHPCVPPNSSNGICCGRSQSSGSSVKCCSPQILSLSDAIADDAGHSSHSVDRSLSSSSGMETTPAGDTVYYYFALSFEEHRNRYILFLRTPSAQEYIKWTTNLRLYVHEGSARTVVPVVHPLESNRPPPRDVNYRRIQKMKKRDELHGREPYEVPMQLVNMRDPDACSLNVLHRVTHLALEWNEGERERIVARATALQRRYSMTSAASDSLTEELNRSQVAHVQSLWNEMNMTCQVVRGDELSAFDDNESSSGEKVTPSNYHSGLRTEDPCGISGLTESRDNVPLNDATHVRGLINTKGNSAHGGCMQTLASNKRQENSILTNPEQPSRSCNPHATYEADRSEVYQLASSKERYCLCNDSK